MASHITIYHNTFRISTVCSSRSPVNLQCLRNLSKTVETPPQKSNSPPLPPVSTATQTTTAKEMREVQIPVPWGHISGKWWGPIDKQPMLCLHGWKDNAATFDNIIPHLNVESLLAVDLAGHGRSSRYPIGNFYHYIDEVVTVRRIANHYKWDKLAMLAHSFGCTVASGYAAFFPENVSTLIQLECTRGRLVIQDKYASKVWKNALENNLTVEKRLVNSHREQYSYDEIVKLFAVSHRNDITIEASKVILSRGITKAADDKYSFTSDPRLRLCYMGFPNEEWMLAHASEIKCDVLAITATEGIAMGERDAERVYLGGLAEMEKAATRFEHHDVEGKHFVHLEAPERVAAIINRFLAGKKDSTEKFGESSDAALKK